MSKVRFSVSLLCALLLSAVLSACGGGGGGGSGGSVGTGSSSGAPTTGVNDTHDDENDNTDTSDDADHPTDSGPGTTPTMTTPKISAAAQYTLAIEPDGSLWGWGIDGAGQLGQGANSYTTKLSPIRIGGDNDWVGVAACENYSIALKSDGSLWFAGSVLNDISHPFIHVLTRLGTDNDWALVRAGSHHALAIKSDGSLWAWGNNAYGQLGLGDDAPRDMPTRIGAALDWIAIAAGDEHSFAIKSDHSLWAWGSNRNGQLGLGDTLNRNVPTRVGSAFDWSTVAAGHDHSLGVKLDGTLWSWGMNYYSQLGNGLSSGSGANPDVYSPVQIDDATDWSSAVAGTSNSFAIKSNGTLWAWGYGQFFQLGLDTQGEYTVPTQVGTDTDWISVSHGSDLASNHTAALKSDGTKWSWGDNDWGELGLGDRVQRQTPTKIPETPPTTTANGASSCLVGKWKTPSCGGTKQQILLLETNGSGAFTNPDCNNICNPLVFNFNYTANGSNVTLNYGVPAPVECSGYGTQQPPQPNDDSFAYTCSATELTTTTSLGTVTYTK